MGIMVNIKYRCRGIQDESYLPQVQENYNHEDLKGIKNTDKLVLTSINDLLATLERSKRRLVNIDSIDVTEHTILFSAERT